jgi:hypothetical protein
MENYMAFKMFKSIDDPNELNIAATTYYSKVFDMAISDEIVTTIKQMAKEMVATPEFQHIILDSIYAQAERMPLAEMISAAVRQSIDSHFKEIANKPE